MSVPRTEFQQFGPLSDGGNSCEVTLLRAAGEEVTEDNESWFEVATPDVKCVTMVRVSIRCPASARVDPNFHNSFGDDGDGEPYRFPARLFITSCSRDRGPTVPVPTRAFAGSAGSPLLIPTEPALWGYEQEVETVGGPLFGCLIVGGNLDALDPADPLGPSDFTGNKSEPPVGFDWIVSVRYSSRVPMGLDDWKQVCGGAGVRVLKGGKVLR